MDLSVTAKAEIVARLGETAVLLPGLIADALAANDRIKLALSLLQEAEARVLAPERASALPSAPLPGIPTNYVAGAKAAGTGWLYAPGTAALVAGLASDLAAMMAPLRAMGADAALLARADTIAAALPCATDDRLALDAIDRLASVTRGESDSLHLVVMDAHKALNRLAAETAVETLDGARVHGLDDAARRAVKAFMRGLDRTRHLAFGHPGLGTTAVRAGERLTIQNDIGTTDAHVLVIHVDAAEVSVTYTDVHRPRAKFFVALFDGETAAWTPLAERAAPGMDEDVFYLVTGRFAFSAPEERDRILELLGSRIVFLIDWNKARKALQTFVGKNTAADLLLWSARHDYGHRAFLDLGGRDLVFDAVQRVAAGRIPYGARLDAALGAAECREFLEHVLRDTSQGLSAERTARLIRDEIQADLARRFETAESAALTVLVRHLGLTRVLAEAIAALIARPALGTAAERRSLARRAKQIEAKADRLTVAARDIAARLREAGLLRPVIDEIENATDALEDCAFLLSIVPEGSLFDVGALAALADTVTDSAGELVRAVEAASRLPEGQRGDAVASLQAIDAVVVAERSADATERDAFAAFMASPQADARALVLGFEIARALETATDHLSHAALSLRDRVLAELSA